MISLLLRLYQIFLNEKKIPIMMYDGYVRFRIVLNLNILELSKKTIQSSL